MDINLSLNCKVSLLLFALIFVRDIAEIWCTFGRLLCYGAFGDRHTGFADVVEFHVLVLGLSCSFYALILSNLALRSLRLLLHDIFKIGSLDTLFLLASLVGCSKTSEKCLGLQSALLRLFFFSLALFTELFLFDAFLFLSLGFLFSLFLQALSLALSLLIFTQFLFFYFGLCLFLSHWLEFCQTTGLRSLDLLHRLAICIQLNLFLWWLYRFHWLLFLFDWGGGLLCFSSCCSSFFGFFLLSLFFPRESSFIAGLSLVLLLLFRSHLSSVELGFSRSFIRSCWSSV